MIDKVLGVGRTRRPPGSKDRQVGNRARDARDWPAAAAAFGRYLAEVPSDWAIWVQHGHALKEAGDAPGALESYRRALAFAPDEADTLLHLGSLLKVSGQVEEGMDYLGRSAKLGNPHAVAMLEATAAERMRDRRMVHLNHYRVMLASFPRQVWIGTDVISGVETIDLYSRTNFRAPGRFHNRFQVVWLFERLLSDLPESQWPLIVDEAIRLLDEEGRLVVRHDQNDNISLMMLRAALARRPGISVTMEPHIVEDNRIINAVFTIRRGDIQEYRDKSWSFIVLAQGDRTPNVLLLLDRLKASAGVNYEVIIVGPRLREYASPNVLVFDKKYRSDYAQIALKKNEAAKFASNANLCILHDRYFLANDFFSGFDEFGYDFDFVAVSQKYRTGEGYPFYSELSGKPLIWSAPIHRNSYQDFRATHFVNGGFTVFKRVMFDRIGYNPLLAWNEAEDVEVSRAFAAHFLPPRVNVASTAITTVSTAHTAMFLPDPVRTCSSSPESR